MKKQVYDYPVGLSSTRTRMVTTATNNSCLLTSHLLSVDHLMNVLISPYTQDIIDAVQARISLESSEIKTERRNLSTAEAKARQRKETKWYARISLLG